jgi:hypothetical protein
MKRFVLFGILLATAAGCAPFKDAYYIEREFGKDSQAAWDALVVNKNSRYGDRMPDGMAGITAEEVISVRNKTFGEKPIQSRIYEFDMGAAK